MSREGLMPRRGKMKRQGNQQGHVPSDYAAMMDGLERALAFSRAAFHAIVDKSADGIIVLNLKGTICFANPAAEFMLGKSLEELLGEPFGIPVVPGETTELDILRNGSPALVAEMRVAETEWQAHPAYLATLRDVTERKRYEQKLARLSAIVESTHHAVVGLTLEGVITTWNEGAERLYGYSGKEAIGQSISLLIPPERAGEHREILEKIHQ